MDSNEITKLIQAHNPTLGKKFYGCFPCDVLTYLQPGTFQIVNTVTTLSSSSSSTGLVVGHWLLIMRLENSVTPKSSSLSKKRQTNDHPTIVFYDSFGRTLRGPTFRLSVYKQLLRVFGTKCKICQYMPSKSFKQSNNSSLCGLYCIFFAHVIYNSRSTTASTFISGKFTNTFLYYATEEDVLRFGVDCFDTSFSRYILYV